MKQNQKHILVEIDKKLSYHDCMLSDLNMIRDKVVNTTKEKELWKLWDKLKLLK